MNQYLNFLRLFNILPSQELVSAVNTYDENPTDVNKDYVHYHFAKMILRNPQIDNLLDLTEDFKYYVYKTDFDGKFEQLLGDPLTQTGETKCEEFKRM